jgi:hypothetical protein
MERDLSIPSAREERAKLKLFHSHLNHSEIVPEQAYRRNSGSYLLVSYLNNICGLYLSKNYEVIPIFINRAHQHMQEYPPSASSKAHYELASAYIRQMAYVLSTYTNITKECLSLIPDEILAAGPQVPAREQGT